jgi:DNA-directed RNA polymerase subunit H
MASLSSTRILTIFKSRKTILELLRSRDYNTEEYEFFSINEIDAMSSNQQLDMLLQHNTNITKTYVKYFLTSKQLRPSTLDEIVEDLFVIDEILTKSDTLVIIGNEEPNDTILTKIKYLHDHDGIFIIFHNMARLQFNILSHSLIPSCRILQYNECEELKMKYKLKSYANLPEISRFDPLAMAKGLRPGEILEIFRKSYTALTYKYYRICI